MPPDASGGKSSIQAIGSSRSYAKRYAITDFFNLRLVEEDELDNDGNLRTRKPQGKGKATSNREDQRTDKENHAAAIAKRLKAEGLTDERYTNIVIGPDFYGSPCAHWRRLPVEWIEWLDSDEAWDAVLAEGKKKTSNQTKPEPNGGDYSIDGPEQLF